MSDPRRTPPMAWMSAFDLTPWAGVAVLKRGDEGDPVSVSSTAGIALDPIHALCGYGSGVAFDSELTPEDCSIELTADDRLIISNDRMAGKLTLAVAGAAAFGFDIAFPAEIEPGGTLVANRTWRRGLLWGGSGETVPRLSFTIEEVIGVKEAPSDGCIAQSIITALRVRGDVEDLDDSAACLEAWDIAVNGAGIRWGLTDQGHVYWSGTSATAAQGLTWLDETFMRRLGFTGEEPLESDDPENIGIVAGVLVYQIATYPCPGVVVPGRPIRAQTPIVEEESATVRLTDGSWSGNWVGSYRGFLVEWMLDGPDSAVDTSDQWLTLREVYCHAGEPLTLCQSWGDPRRARRVRTLGDEDAYSLGHTSDRDGYRGRILGRLHPDSGREDRVEWDGSLRLRAPISTRITVREDGV